MKKMLVKTLCVLGVLSFCSVSFAQQYNSTAPQKNQNDSCRKCEICPPSEPCEPCCEPCKACEICPPCEPCKPCCTEVPKTGEPCNCAYNAPARIDPACGCDAWVSGTFLYWQAKEKGLIVGYEYYDAETTPPTVHYVKPINIEFDYHPAFKVGAGISFCRDDWTLFLQYTRFTSVDSKTMDIEAELSATNYLTTPWLSDAAFRDTYYYLKGKWELKYNMFDLELGRPYYLGKKLVFKPHVGLRGGWIDQEFKLKSISFVDDATTRYYAKSEQDTWLIGPRAGLGTDWLVSCDFRIFGNFSGSLTYQNFEVKGIQVKPIQEGITQKLLYVKTNDFSQITPNVEFSLGLGYGTYFCNYQWYFDLTVGYDFNYYWNQNWLRYNTNNNYNLDADAGNLMMHGLNVTARLDF